MTIVLIGYMASGKTSVGKLLAKKLNYRFIDLDDFIEEKEGATIKEIFNSKGEIYFRKKETQYLKELLQANEENTVLSLGGGAPCFGENMDEVLKAKHAISIYLKGTVPFLANKLVQKRSKRPLISHIDNVEDMSEFVGKHLFERMPFYSKAEKHVVIDHKSKPEIVEDMVSILF
ncbi:shikimate kinase [Algibacter mikhailovii]|uniref:Shikimate kinase n=1 Tax=Algibacter mikhailovii TaxID=425498 RepID=A0A918VFT3_9FLAO|nr:shikimate kinase [Algibacter mikhailovii]GGZ93934.1 shikimate kinase [Algibacter mikhailovii]